MRLNQVTMPCTNVAESVEFYTKLGLIQIVASDHYARFVCPTETRLSPPAWWTRSTAGLSPSCTSSATTSTAPSESLSQRASFSTHGPRISGGCGAKRWLHDPANNNVCLYHADENRLNPPWRIPSTE